MAHFMRARLRPDWKGLQDENGRVIAERAGAFRAVEVLQARLKRHGIDADFRETEDDRRALLGST